MGPIKALNQFIILFIDTFKQFGRLRIWLILIIYFIIIWLLLYAHYRFLSPVFYPLVSFWVSLFGKDAATAFSHYPGQFMYLPYFFGWAKLLAGFILEGLVLGWVAALLADGFRKTETPDKPGLKKVLPLWLHLVIVWTVINGLIVLVNFFLPDLLQAFHQDSPRRLLAVRFVILPFVLAVILALFFFVFPAVTVFRDNFIGAMRRSLKMFFRRPITCFFLAVVIMAVPYLISAIPPDILILKFKPELVYWTILVGLAAELLANFFWMGTAVRFLIEEEGL
ncbi:MAG: hypothetical protein PHU88_00560 [candidate division Zixibacteria bacterium]|nr:hypothetical protein [candidate division Zixibacteria bacterium]MDD5425412.1 hypothetical protein [candidate division Zixibacteria bacterium]